MKIAIIEDDREAAKLLESHVQQYCKGKNLALEIDFYQESVSFMDAFHSQYEILFMDIDLPGQSGMSNAEEIRKTDNNVALIFVTNMPSYAVKGYLVNALDFLVKPVSYSRFLIAMNKAMKQLSLASEKHILTVKTTEGVLRLPAEDILYITVSDHLLSFHTMEKEVLAWMSFKDAMELLKNDSFSQSNKGVLINLRDIRRITPTEIEIPGTTLSLSRTRKKQFMEDFEAYCSSI